MEFIKAEEFLKQPVEVQKVFLDWWVPNIGDLFAYRNTNLKSFGVLFDDGEIENYKYNKGNDNFATFKIDSIPLFTEGQLRQFIEDKTKNTIRINPNYYEKCYLVNVDTGKRGFNGLSESLLYAYWEVAIQIAKEG